MSIPSKRRKRNLQLKYIKSQCTTTEACRHPTKTKPKKHPLSIRNPYTIQAILHCLKSQEQQELISTIISIISITSTPMRCLRLQVSVLMKNSIIPITNIPKYSAIYFVTRTSTLIVTSTSWVSLLGRKTQVSRIASQNRCLGHILHFYLKEMYKLVKVVDHDTLL